MSKLFASLESEHRLIFDESNEAGSAHFIIPEVQQEIPFNSEVSLSDDEWFYIKVDSLHAKMIDVYTNNASNLSGVNLYQMEESQGVRSLYKLDEGSCIWQKITKSKRLKNKKILGFNLNKPVLQEAEGIEFTENVDAYFDQVSSKLYFRSFKKIRNLFAPEINDYYKIASPEEVSSFKKLGIAVFADNLNWGERNQKTLKAILDDEDINLEHASFKSKKLQKLIKEYAKDELVLNENKQVLVNTPKDLTCLLTVISGRRYKNPVTNAHMEATHSKKLSVREEVL